MIFASERLPDSAGKIYYQFYCNFCHGQIGGKTGPVGESFTPTPPDLLLPEVQEMDESTFIQRMISGKSHDPLIPYVVPPRSLSYIAGYVLGF